MARWSAAVPDIVIVGRHAEIAHDQAQPIIGKPYGSALCSRACQMASCMHDSLLRLGSGFGHYRFDSFAAVPVELEAQIGQVDPFAIVADDVVKIDCTFDLQLGSCRRICHDVLYARGDECNDDRCLCFLRGSF